MSFLSPSRVLRRETALVAILLCTGCGGAGDGRATGGGTTGPAPVDTTVASVPSAGSPGELDVVSWNVEWFGHLGNGPANEPLQLRAAQAVIQGTDADVWGLVEIVGKAQWDSLDARLTAYSGLLASDAAVTGGATYYSADEQKPAILWRSSLATLVGARVILTANDHAFAGRPPLEVQLDVTLGGATERVVVIVLHMKAFADQPSWERRRDAATALKGYLDATWPTQRVLVIGDWNDDVDRSIVAGQATPYEALVADSARYRFITASLSAAGTSTIAGYPDPIDHHLATNEAAAAAVASATRVLRPDQQITGFTERVSDHFPVLTRYRVGN